MSNARKSFDVQALSNANFVTHPIHSVTMSNIGWKMCSQNAPPPAKMAPILSSQNARFNCPYAILPVHCAYKLHMHV